MSNYVHNYDVLIREVHLDTFGHMNNATYLQLYEEARWQLITERGYDLNKIKVTQQGPVILEVNVKFQKEIGLREKIRITTELKDYPGKFGRIIQKMIKENGDVASEALFVFGLFDLKSRKLIEPTAEWKYAVGIG